jgi:alcohol dehydrogenase
MRALLFDGSAPKLVTNHPDPEIQADEAIVRPVKVAVSDLDLELCRGLLGFQGVLGHQFVGVVEAVNGQGGDLQGKRVVGSIHAVCGDCDLCRKGLPTHCRQQTILGVRGRDGCLADRFRLPARNLVPVPDDLDDDHAVFAVPASAAVHVARQLAIEGKPYITVLGDGIAALIMVQVLSALNASVRLVGRNAERMSLCERWEIKHRLADDVGRRADQDIVVDCTGTPEGLELALQLVRPKGKVVLRTLLAAPAVVDLSPLVLNEIELIGSASGPIGEGLALLRRRDVDVVSLLGRRARLDDGPALLQAAAGDRVVVEI